MEVVGLSDWTCGQCDLQPKTSNIKHLKPPTYNPKTSNLKMNNALDTQDIMFPNCPIRNVLARIGDKWSLLVMHTLMRNDAPMRFSALQKAIPDISQKVLTKTLRTLETDGFVIRNIYPEIPPRVEYHMTERGFSFMEACKPMLQWALENLVPIIKDRQSATRHKKQAVD